ncbi:MAG: bifunctional precorrin-2 dehydrogenase/sirohydrochlorin ferrochelatase [Actinomycetota bacterium]
MATEPPTNPNPTHPSYPVMLDLRDRRCLVVGGGNVALRKVQGLLDAGATVEVVAPWIHPDLLELRGSLFLRRRRYRTRHLAGAHLVITCTDDPEVNARVAAEATERRIWVNSADDPDNCSFTLPSVARQGDLSVMVSTNGRSPALSRWLRRRFEQEFDASWTELIDVLAEVRAEARAVLGTSEIAGWDAALDDALVDLVRTGRTAAAADTIRRHLGLAVAA